MLDVLSLRSFDVVDGGKIHRPIFFERSFFIIVKRVICLITLLFVVLSCFSVPVNAVESSEDSFSSDSSSVEHKIKKLPAIPAPALEMEHNIITYVTKEGEEPFFLLFAFTSVDPEKRYMRVVNRGGGAVDNVDDFKISLFNGSVSDPPAEHEGLVYAIWVLYPERTDKWQTKIYLDIPYHIFQGYGTEGEPGFSLDFYTGSSVYSKLLYSNTDLKSTFSNEIVFFPTPSPLADSTTYLSIHTDFYQPVRRMIHQVAVAGGLIFSAILLIILVARFRKVSKV